MGNQGFHNSMKKYTVNIDSRHDYLSTIGFTFNKLHLGDSIILEYSSRTYLYSVLDSMGRAGETYSFRGLLRRFGKSYDGFVQYKKLKKRSTIIKKILNG